VADFYPAAVWAGAANVSNAESRAWTAVVVAAMEKNLSLLNQAKDVNDFCPGYASAATDQQVVCWLRIVGGVVEYESSFDPNSIFKEPDSGEDSIGLLSLSTTDCPAENTIADLENPVSNLACGMQIMMRLISRDGYISGPDSERGAAAYWSTLRAPYSSGKLKDLGKKPEIESIAKDYQNYIKNGEGG
jgi:hypothetical protein